MCEIECINGKYDFESGECICQEGYFGLNCNSLCQKQNDQQCIHGACLDKCSDYLNSGKNCPFDYICVCDDGYYGNGFDKFKVGRPQGQSKNHKSQNCENENNCKNETCRNGGICDSNDYLYNGCDCRNTGYHGVYCQQPDCSDSFCLNGKCDFDPFKPNSPFCDCGQGYEGEHCQNSKCIEEPCLNNGKCKNSEDYPFAIEVLPV